MGVRSDQPAPSSPRNADQLAAVTGVQLMQGIGHRPAQGFWTEAWSRVLRRPGAVLGLAWVGIVAFFAVFAPLVANGHPILLAPAGDVGPLGLLMDGLVPAASSADGLRLLAFTAVWTVAWIAAPSRLSPEGRLVTGLLATIPFALRVFAQFFVGVPEGDPVGDRLRPLTDFVLGEGTGLSGMGFQIIIDTAVVFGLVWAAGVFGLSHKARWATAPLLWIAAAGGLLGMAADVRQVGSPMLANLTVVDLSLLVGGLALVVLLVPPWWGSRADRGRVLLTVAMQAGLTLLVWAILSERAASRDAAQWVRDLERQPWFEMVASMGIAGVVGAAFAWVHPVSTPTRGLGVSLLAGLALFGFMASRWSTPLANYPYAAQIAAGEKRALFAPVPWSPQQGGTAVDLLDPGRSVYGQVRKGVRLRYGQEAAAAGVSWEELPLDEGAIEEIGRQLEFASGSLPASPVRAVREVRRASEDGRATTIGEALDVLDTLPGPRYALGTDSLGQDVLSQMLHACRLSISIGLVSTAIAVSIGVTIGALMGYFGGWVDMVLYRLVEVFMAIPLLFLLIVAAAVLPKNTYVMMAIIGCVTWTGSARYIRAEFYKLRGQDFVQSARAVGLPVRSVLFKHMLPNGVTPVLVEASFAIALAILTEAILSYLGLGPANQASWGRLLSDATNQVGDFVWWLAIFPGLAIFLTVLSYNLIGEALRDAIDPKLKKARV